MVGNYALHNKPKNMYFVAVNYARCCFWGDV